MARSLLRLLLQLLVWTSSYSRALDNIAYYKNLTLPESKVSKSITVPSLCTCFTICQVKEDCTAATFVSTTPDSTENCRISNEKGIFKKDLQTVTDPDTVTVIVGYQLYFSEEILQPAAAKKRCENMSLRLAPLSDEASFNYVRGRLMEMNLAQESSYLVGLFRINGVWTWTDGVTNVGQGRWAIDKPGSDQTSFVAFKKKKDHLLVDVSSDIEQNFICST